MVRLFSALPRVLDQSVDFRADRLLPFGNLLFQVAPDESAIVDLHGQCLLEVALAIRFDDPAVDSDDLIELLLESLRNLLTAVAGAVQGSRLGDCVAESLLSLRFG